MKVVLIKNGIVDNVAVGPIDPKDSWYLEQEKAYDKVLSVDDSFTVSPGDTANEDGTFTAPSPT